MKPSHRELQSRAAHDDCGAPPGRIEVFCGCMFSGKTTHLIERLSAEAIVERRVMAFKHGLDTRYDPCDIVAHNHDRFRATPVRDAGSILQRVGDAEVVGIDEAQFFGLPLVDVCLQLAARGCRVLVAGIDNDAWGRPFPPLPQLKDIADEVEQFSVPCAQCGAPARFSQRMLPLADDFMVGGAGMYEPRCSACFVPLPDPPAG